MHKEQVIYQFATRIIWVYSLWQSEFYMIRELYYNLEFEKNWRNSIFYLLSSQQSHIFVLDDQMGVVSLRMFKTDFFTKMSHHWK